MIIQILGNLRRMCTITHAIGIPGLVFDLALIKVEAGNEASLHVAAYQHTACLHKYIYGVFLWA